MGRRKKLELLSNAELCKELDRLLKCGLKSDADVRNYRALTREIVVRFYKIISKR